MTQQKQILIRHPSGTTFAVSGTQEGMGSYGSFHRATYSENGESKAFGVKFIPYRSGLSPEQKEAVKQQAKKEQEIAALLRDEANKFSVVSTAEVQQTSLSAGRVKFPEGIFIFQPRLNGKPLDKISQGELSQLSTADRLDLAAQLVNQLKMLQDASFGHFDLKNDNVIVDLDAKPPKLHLIDFGMSEHILDEKGTKVWNRTGNPGYYAPEGFKAGDWYGIQKEDIAGGYKPEIGVRTDVYMANNILLKLLGVDDPISKKYIGKDYTQDEIKKRLSQGFSLEKVIDFPKKDLPEGTRDLLLRFIDRTQNIDPQKRPSMQEAADFYQNLVALAHAHEGRPSFEKEQEKSIHWARLHLIDSGVWEATQKYSDKDILELSQGIVTFLSKGKQEQLQEIFNESFIKIAPLDLLLADRSVRLKQMASMDPLQQVELFQALRARKINFEHLLGSEKYASVENELIQKIENNARLLPPFETIQYLSAITPSQRHVFLTQLDYSQKSVLLSYLKEEVSQQIFPAAEPIESQLSLLMESSKAAPKAKNSYESFFDFFKPFKQQAEEAPIMAQSQPVTPAALEEKKNSQPYEEKDFSLHNALTNEQWDVAEQLIKSGRCNLNQQDSGGNTPLHIAVGHGQEGMVELLLQRGADSNIQNEKLETPLHLAVRAEDITNATVLLEAGAKTSIKDMQGKDVIELLTEMEQRPLQSSTAQSLLETIKKSEEPHQDESRGVILLG